MRRGGYIAALLLLAAGARAQTAVSGAPSAVEAWAAFGRSGLAGPSVAPQSSWIAPLYSALELQPALKTDLAAWPALTPARQAAALKAVEAVRAQAAPAAAAALSASIKTLPPAQALSAANDAWTVYGAPRAILAVRDQALLREANARGRREVAAVAEMGAALAAPTDKDGLEAWIKATKGELRREQPKMFALMLKKAAATDQAMNRTFPQLMYRLLAESPDAARVAATPKVVLAGDNHGGNVEVVEFKRWNVVQGDDYDDAGEGPAALDSARGFISAAISGGKTDKQARALYRAARAEYKRSLKEGFKSWARRVSEEPAVVAKVDRVRDWRQHGGAAITGARAREAHKISGVSNKWTPTDDEGAGGSSIGVPNIAFTRPDKRSARQLKGLRDEPAMIAFTGTPSPAPARERMAAGYALRRVPAKARTVEGPGRDWLVRHREYDEAGIDLDKGPSVARVMGGLTAQVQRRQVDDPKSLIAAAEAVSEETAMKIVRRIREMRRHLRALLREGRLG